MDRVAAMRALVAAVEAGSFSAVGRLQGVAPSSISRQISELESVLGVRLLHRTTRRLSLTEAGEIYCERARRILTEFDEAQLAVAELGAPSGILRISMPTGIGREVIVSAMPGFQQRYPGVRVVASLTDEMVDLVEGRVDVAVRVGRLADSSLKARKIGESRRVVCASPAYLERASRPRRPEDLERHDCIPFRDHPGSNPWRFRRDGSVVTVRASGRFFARSADAMAAAAVAGMGLVLLPDWNIGVELRQRQLVPVLKGWEPVPGSSPIWAVHSQGRHVPSKVRAFVDFLADSFAGGRL